MHRFLNLLQDSPALQHVKAWVLFSSRIKIPKIRRVSPDCIGHVFCDKLFCWSSSRLETRRPDHPAPGSEGACGGGQQLPAGRRAGMKAWTRAANVFQGVRRMLPKKSSLELGDAYLGQRLSPELKFLSVARHRVHRQTRSSFYCKTFSRDRQSPRSLWWAFSSVFDCRITTLYTWK